MELIDLAERTFGRLTVVGRTEDHIRKGGRHDVMWRCKCECGNYVSVSGEALRSGRTVSCGCFKKNYMSQKMSTHRETHTKLYGVWCSMKARCHNKNTIAYESYGGRGITVCDEWRNDYSKFSEWALANGYATGKSIDRIDNNRGYSPDNCRFVDAKIQACNRRSNRILTLGDESHTVTEWAEILGKNPKTLFSRVYAGLSTERILAN